MSHHRVMVVEVMGRYAGWLGLESGIAGGGDVILIPEIPYDIDLNLSWEEAQQEVRGRQADMILSASHPIIFRFEIGERDLSQYTYMRIFTPNPSPIL